MSNRKEMWGGVIFVALLIIGGVAIAHQWGLMVLVAAFLIAVLLRLVISYFSGDGHLAARKTLDVESRALRIAMLANVAHMVLTFFFVIAGIVAVGLLWGIWAAVALTIAWILWFSF